MNVQDIRLKRHKLRIIEHHILPVLIVFRFIENRLNPCVQKEKLQHVPNIMRRGTAENCYALLQPALFFFS